MATPARVAASLDPMVEQPMRWAAWASSRGQPACGRNGLLSPPSADIRPVDHILVEALVHELVDSRLNPGLAESRKILAGVAVEQKLVVNQLVGHVGIGARAWKPVFGKRLRREVRDGGPGRIQGRGADALKFAECGHVGQILERSQKPCLRHERATPNRVVVGLGALVPQIQLCS
jgi:hypothetical protein